MRKKISIALLAFSLAMLVANFLVRRVGKMLPPSEQEIETAEEPFFPFGMPQKDYNIPQQQVTEYLQLENDYQPQDEEIKPIYKTELTEEERKTIETYTQNPKLQEFIKELSAVISPEELEQENYLNVAYKPEVRNIFVKYSKDEEFREIAATVMKDKDLLQFAETLVQNNEVQK